MSHDMGTFIVLDLTPINPCFGVGVKPQVMSKSTLDYTGKMCQSAFENSEYFKSYGGGRGLTMGNPVSECVHKFFFG